MTLKTLGTCRGLVYAVIAAFALLVLPVGQVAYAAGTAPRAGTGSLAGFVYGKDMKTPVTGAVVKIRNLKDRAELASQPTDSNGVFSIPDIPEGRYIVGVTSGPSDFNFDYSVHVKAGELGKLSVALAPGAGGQEQPQPVPAKKAGFFGSAAGRALLITVVGVGVYFLFFNEPSPDRS